MGGSGKTKGEDLVGRHKNLGKRTALLSSLTLLSRILGLLREKLSATLFGDTSAVFDAFITAWRVPNLFRRFLGEGALSTAFQTAQTETEGAHGKEAGRRLFHDTARMLTGLLLGVMVVTMGAIYLMPDQMPVTGWNWLGSDPAPVRELALRVMPFVLLACLSALATGALHVRGKFEPPAWAPVCMNVVWIATLLALPWLVGDAAPGVERDLERAKFLAWGVLLAGVVQLAVQVPTLRAQGLMGPQASLVPRPVGAPGAWTVLKRSAPLALGAAVYQINVMVDGLMAEGLLPDGGPTCYYYAGRLQQFPVAMVAVAATSAVFPLLQAHAQGRDFLATRKLHDRTQRAIAFWALPATCGLWILAEPVVAVCLGGGEFGAEGIERTSEALRLLTLTILPVGASGLLARTYYSMGDMKTPVRISSAMLITNIVLNVVFIRGMGMDVAGLALASAITAWGNLLLLFPGLGGRLGLPATEDPLLGPTVRMALAAAVCGLVAGVTHDLGSEPLGDLGALALAVGAGAFAYALAARALSIKEFRELQERVRAKLQNVKGGSD
ncbi:MAG: murein biosynthesis integral membrane protein MurJ [bacterium]